MSARAHAAAARALFPEAEPIEPKGEPERHLCPVGMCRPDAGVRVDVEGPGRLCKRHFAKLSHPLARQLGYAQAAGGDALAQVLSAAITEARRNDPDWYPWTVCWRVKLDKPVAAEPINKLHVEGFHDWEQAVRRVASLFHCAKIRATIRNVDFDSELSLEQVAWRCTHRVEDGAGALVQRGRTLSAALFELDFRTATDRERWTVINEVTGRAMSYAVAQVVEERGAHA